MSQWLTVDVLFYRKIKVFKIAPPSELLLMNGQRSNFHDWKFISSESASFQVLSNILLTVWLRVALQADMPFFVVAVVVVVVVVVAVVVVIVLVICRCCFPRTSWKSFTWNTTLAKKNWDNRTHVAQARDLSSMHAPMFGLACLSQFFWPG